MNLIIHILLILNSVEYSSLRSIITLVWVEVKTNQIIWLCTLTTAYKQQKKQKNMFLILHRYVIEIDSILSELLINAK